MNNWVKYLLVVALTANAAVFGVFLWNKLKPPPERHLFEVLAETLHFDAEQQRQYHLLLDRHIVSRDSILLLFETYRQQVYTQLGSADSTKRSELLTAIGNVQRDMERDRAAHFMAVRALCRPDQTILFDKLMTDVSLMFTRKPPPPRNGGR